MNYERPELLDRLAGAYVLGTMAARARPRFARLLAESPQAQRAVAAWNNELAPLASAVKPVAPPSAVWDAIAAHTQPRPHVAPSAAAATAPSGWWHKLRGSLDGWGRPAVAFCLGAVLAFGLVKQNAGIFGMHHTNASLPASYVGILSDAKGDAVLTAGSHRRGHTMTIKLLKPLVIPPGMVARMWALPMDNGAPIPITDVPASGNVTIHLNQPAEDMFFKVKLLAVSFETDPNAATPASPFVLSGHCVKFW
ncbi:anti-sigma-K factor RskA [Duganella sp. 1224]|uniref:anti-sigma factor n=1 Tax=Duganella sp. 1224 TaxID=2587052 RepID=UPI0015CADCF8|nr:anti-sigma factor [Duganella sp. 1224]NYE60074.1 anti-sigma-K factor RskA [Duganella sp. 1224]